MSDVIVRTLQRATTDFKEFIFWEQYIFRFLFYPIVMLFIYISYDLMESIAHLEL
jgi:hypothetical protein